MVDSEDDQYPVYPYEASIFIDVANGYDIYDSPDLQSAHDEYNYDQYFDHEREEEYFN